jgi:hypothetical protein
VTTLRYTFTLTLGTFMPLPVVELALEVTEPDEEPAPKETEQ